MEGGAPAAQAFLGVERSLCGPALGSVWAMTAQA